MFPGLPSPLPDAVKGTEFVDRHGRVVAIKGELRSSGLRFDPSLSSRAGPAPHVEDRAGVLVVVGKVVGKGRAALLHAWT